MSIKELWGLDSDEEEEEDVRPSKSKIIYVPVDQLQNVKQEKSQETSSPNKDEQKHKDNTQQQHHKGKQTPKSGKGGQKRYNNSSTNSSPNDHYQRKKYDSAKQHGKTQKKYVPKDKSDENLTQSKKPTQTKTLIEFDDPEIEGLKVQHEFTKTDSINELEQQISILKEKYKISQETEDKIFKAIRENWKNEEPKSIIQI